MSDVRFSGFAIPALFAASVAIAAPASKPDVVELVPHRAVYDLKLASARGNKPVESVRGRILYDFSGSACEGYALQFRQVSQIDAGEGAVMTTDLRATTWEDAAAKIFRFNSQNYIDQKLKTSVDGRAERTGVRVGVNLNKPAVKKFGLDQNGIFFPTDHMRRIILAARAGQTLLEGPVFDGSDNGDRIYDTLSVIGAPIDPQKKPDDAGAKDEVLLNMRRWPVSISYFERANDKPNKPGEQTPIYSIRFELYENGISRALALDYNDFVVAGEMTQLEIRPAKPCK
jgi:hypothetical protein